MSIFTLHFWFRHWLPEMNVVAACVFALLALVLLVVGLVLTKRAGKRRRTDRRRSQGLSRLSAWFISLSVLLFIWDFFAFEHINILGAPYWLLAMFIAYLIWLGFILWYFFKTIPKFRANEQARIEREKYLPKRKV